MTIADLMLAFLWVLVIVVCSLMILGLFAAIVEVYRLYFKNPKEKP